MAKSTKHKALKAYHLLPYGEAGCDEAGRGCLSGPVVAGAVMLPKGYKNKRLNDSKVLSKKAREELREEILKDATHWGVGIVTPLEIDDINILNASFLAMHRAVDALGEIPQRLLIDGNRFNPYKDIAHDCIIKGDGKYLSIAAASILAKTHRDDLMETLAQKFPHYGWERNAGYPTKQHREAIRQHGATPEHRMTFRLLPEQLVIPFK